MLLFLLLIPFFWGFFFFNDIYAIGYDLGVLDHLDIMDIEVSPDNIYTLYKN